MLELDRVPAGKFDDAIVERRLEESGGRVVLAGCDGVDELVERNVERELRCNGSERVARRLRCERGRARKARVGLDALANDAVAAAFGRLWQLILCLTPELETDAGPR